MRPIIRIADWPTEQSALLTIRIAVFVEEQGVPLDLEHDEHDALATHLLAADEHGERIGTAHLLSSGHIGRIAVLAAHRGRGIGSALLLELLRLAHQRGLREVFLNAQCSAESFYERHGFVREGEIFVDAGIDHVRMVRSLAD